MLVVHASCKSPEKLIRLALERCLAVATAEEVRRAVVFVGIPGRVRIHLHAAHGVACFDIHEPSRAVPRIHRDTFPVWRWMRGTVHSASRSACCTKTSSGCAPRISIRSSTTVFGTPVTR